MVDSTTPPTLIQLRDLGEFIYMTTTSKHTLNDLDEVKLGFSSFIADDVLDMLNAAHDGNLLDTVNAAYAMLTVDLKKALQNSVEDAKGGQ